MPPRKQSTNKSKTSNIHKTKTKGEKSKTRPLRSKTKTTGSQENGDSGFIEEDKTDDVLKSRNEGESSNTVIKMAVKQTDFSR